MLLDVYVDRSANFRRTRDYKLHLMLEGLRREAIPWRILDDPHAAPLGSCAFLHVDLTDVPQPFLDAAARYERCINAKASTIRRTLYSTARLMPGSDWAGPVIVKTVLNSRGLPERRYRSRAGISARLAHVARKLANLGADRECPPYTLHKSLADVPDWVWRDDRLMVEKYLPGSLDLPVVKYRYDFLLDHDLLSAAVYTTHLCEPDTQIKVETFSQVPQEIIDLRHELHLDFGAFDYFLVDGKAVAIDANKTITSAQSWVARYPVMAHDIVAITNRLVAYVRGK